MNNRKLVLENGIVFEGIGFGSNNMKVAEIIFNTSVVGYQEMISNPAYCNKIVCMSYPLIGNYGLTDEDYESKHIDISGLVVREYNDLPSNFRYTRTLAEVLEENNVVGISGIDTRELVRIIRDNGSMKALICDIDLDIEECMDIINNYNYPTNDVSIVSCKKVWYSRTPNPMYNVVAIDCGIQLNFVKRLNQAGCNVVVVPYDTTAEAILKYKPNGLFISNGPGNPLELTNVIRLVEDFKGKLPIFGVGLGHHIVACAYGAKVNKMKFGNHGSNYPIRNTETGKVEISSKHCSYYVDRESLNDTTLTITHENVISLDVEGLFDKKNKVMTVQFDPNIPIDERSEDNFKGFVNMMKKQGGKKNA